MESLVSYIEDVLTWIRVACVDLTPRYPMPTEFTGAIPHLPGFEEAKRLASGVDINLVYPLHGDMFSLREPLNVSLLMREVSADQDACWGIEQPSRPSNSVNDTVYGIERYKILSPKQCALRGVKKQGGIVVEECSGYILKTGEWHSYRSFLRISRTHDSLRCQYMNPLSTGNRTWDAYLLNRSKANLSLAIGVQYAYESEWTVDIGWRGHPSIKFNTDPIGAQEIFRLRDIPEGKKRRDALLHWVREHWRKKRTDPSVETKVRTHLRGQTAFEWNGLQCKIKPSIIDLEKNMQARAAS